MDPCRDRFAASGTEIEEAEIRIAEKLGEYRHNGAVRAIGAFSEIADQAPSFVICGAVLGVGLLSGRTQLAAAGTRMLASVVVAAGMKRVVKRMVFRTRPHVLIKQGRYHFQPVGPEGGDNHSFPSGHTAGAVAAARGLARVFPGTSTGAYAAAVVIAGVQIPRAKHYPLDLAAGAIVGLLSEFLVHRADALLSLQGAKVGH